MIVGIGFEDRAWACLNGLPGGNSSSSGSHMERDVCCFVCCWRSVSFDGVEGSRRTGVDGADQGFRKLLMVVKTLFDCWRVWVGGGMAEEECVVEGWCKATWRAGLNAISAL